MSETRRLYLDEHVVRIVAAFVSIITVVILFTGALWLAVLLAIDFAIRAFTRWPSPLAVSGKLLVTLAGWKPKPIFAPPKRFAAAIGFVFAAAIALLLYFQFTTAAYLVAAVLLICALLESVLKVCLGCYVYNCLVVPVLNSLQKNP